MKYLITILFIASSICFGIDKKTPSGTTVKDKPGQSQNQSTTIFSGTYTPIVAYLGGADPSVGIIVNEFRYSRIGNIVQVSGNITIDPVNLGYNELSITLPNDGFNGYFTSGTQASGLAKCFQMLPTAAILSYSGNRKVLFGYDPFDGSSRTWVMTFQYTAKL